MKFHIRYTSVIVERENVDICGGGEAQVGLYNIIERVVRDRKRRPWSVSFSFEDG